MTNKKVNYQITAQNKTQKAFKQVRASISSLAKVGAVSAAAGATAFVAAYAKAAGQIDKLAKTSAKLGIGTKELAGFRQAAELSGVSINTADMALQRMVRRVSEAAAGTGEAKKALEELGISAKELNSLSPDQQFQKIAEKMALVNNQSDKIRLSMRLFDSEGVALVNTLNMGVDALKEAQLEAELFGIAVSKVDAAKIEAANDEMHRVKSVFSGVTNQIAVQFAPVVGALSNRFIELVKEAGGVKPVVEKMVNFSVKGLGFMLDMANGLKVAFKIVRNLVAEVANIFIQFVGAVARFGGNIAEKLGFNSDALDSVDRFSKAFNNTVQGFRDDLNESIMKPVPSEKIKAWTDDFTKKFDQEIKVKQDEGKLKINPLPKNVVSLEDERKKRDKRSGGKPPMAIAMEESLKAVEEGAARIQDLYAGIDQTIQSHTLNVIQGQESVGDAMKKGLAEQAANHLKAKLKESKASGIAAIANAWASAPFPANLPAVAMTTAKTLALNTAISGLTAASFEGGGMTGSGIRAGGIDGKGGKMAVLHPNEKVTDLEKGQGQPNIVINNYSSEKVQALTRKDVIEIMVGEAGNNDSRFSKSFRNSHQGVKVRGSYA